MPASSCACLSTSHEYWISSSNAGTPQVEASVQVVEEYALGEHGSESWWCLRFIAWCFAVIHSATYEHASFGMRKNTISSFLGRRLTALGDRRVICSLTGHSERLFVREYSRRCCVRWSTR
jgi:hypothetical protein